MYVYLIFTVYQNIFFFLLNLEVNLSESSDPFSCNACSLRYSIMTDSVRRAASFASRAVFFDSIVASFTLIASSYADWEYKIAFFRRAASFSSSRITTRQSSLLLKFYVKNTSYTNYAAVVLTLCCWIIITRITRIIFPFQLHIIHLMIFNFYNITFGHRVRIILV